MLLIRFFLSFPILLHLCFPLISRINTEVGSVRIPCFYFSFLLSVVKEMEKVLLVLVLVFWGALFPRTADPIFHESLCLHPPTAGLCPKTLHLDLVFPPEGDSIQVLPAVSFWKRERYRLSYQGRAEKVLLLSHPSCESDEKTN